MFEFNKPIVQRDGYVFQAEEIDWKYIYKTSDKIEIEILIKSWFIKRSIMQSIILWFKLKIEQLKKRV